VQGLGHSNLFGERSAYQTPFRAVKHSGRVALRGTIVDRPEVVMGSGPAGRPLRALVWRRNDCPSLEHFRLWEASDGASLRGAVVASLDGVPVSARYEIACSPSWQTRAVHVVVAAADADEQTLDLTVDERGHWWRGQERVAAFDGCVDVDLGITPATNTLPIRRLGLAVGESRDVVAAWVRFPDLALQTLPQRYTRVAERRYRYESNGGRFVAELDVDELGVVMRYGTYWECVTA
jgi:hypothetical protein